MLAESTCTAGKKDEAKEMVEEIEKATDGMPSPRKEQLNQVWVPLCKGTHDTTLSDGQAGLQWADRLALEQASISTRRDTSRKDCSSFTTPTFKTTFTYVIDWTFPLNSCRYTATSHVATKADRLFFHQVIGGSNEQREVVHDYYRSIQAQQHK
jgi:hypothetical protein